MPFEGEASLTLDGGSVAVLAQPLRLRDERSSTTSGSPAGRDPGGHQQTLALRVEAAVLSLVFAAAAVLSPGTHFTCTPVAVWDGDGPIWCAEGPRVRLAGIAAREIDENCRRGHPCPTTSGRAARDHLVALLGGSTARFGRAMWWFTDRDSAACRTALRKAIGPAPRAVRQR